MNTRKEYYIDGNLAFKTAKVRDDVIIYNGFDGLKTFDELTFSNNFIFCKVMEDNEDLCREMLEMILGMKLSEIHIRKEVVVDPVIDARGTRLDIMVIDEKGSVYDIEMQARDEHNLPRRTRHLQGILDTDAIEKGAMIDDLPMSYVIFIATFDPYDKGLHKYTFKNLCVEDKNLELGDDATKIVLSTKGTADDVSPEMKEFLAYVAGSMPKSDFTQKIDKAVGRTKRSRKMRREYMTLEMYGRELSHKARLEGRKEGIEIGLEQGIEQSLLDSIGKLITKQGLSPEEACRILDYPLEKYYAAEGQEE